MRFVHRKSANKTIVAYERHLRCDSDIVAGEYKGSHEKIKIFRTTKIKFTWCTAELPMMHIHCIYTVHMLL